MKYTLYILLLLSLTSTGQIPINGSGTKLSINGGGSKIDINPYFRQGTIQDNGYYNGFGMMADVVNKETWGVYKKATTHGNPGSLILIHTSYWGDIWTEEEITIDGVTTSMTNNFSFYRYASGRMVLAYRPDTTIHFAISDDNGADFTEMEDVIAEPDGYTIHPCPIKLQESSYGSLILAYYKIGTGGNSAILVESTDEGETWAEKCTIYTSTDTYPTAFPASKGNEIAICETHPTGIEGTSKWIAMMRPALGEGGGYYMVYRSTDGANTWSQDLSTYPGSFTDDDGNLVSSGGFSKSGMYLFLSSDSPVDIKLIGDSVYVVNGNRNTPAADFGLVYLTATPDSAFSNRITSWTRHPYVERYYDGTNPGSSTDYGYPVLFTSGNNVFVAEYTVSSLSPLPGVSRRCLVKTTKIK